jgi:hypothetical protein
MNIEGIPLVPCSLDLPRCNFCHAVTLKDPAGTGWYIPLQQIMRGYSTQGSINSSWDSLLKADFNMAV